MSNNSILVLAYYALTPISHPDDEVAQQRAFLQNRDATCRIYVSKQGINGQMSASLDVAKSYMDWMHSRPPFSELQFKLQTYPEHVFPRLTIKVRKELVAIGIEVDLTKRGEAISPEKWKAMLEEETPKVVIDVRNDYEWKVGRFAGAELPQLEEFRQFPTYVEQLKERVDSKQTPIMMYCTGGIRCEFFSSILLQAGFEKVYQLDGGVINYGNKVGNAHWLGKLFVFDDRLTVPVDPQEPSNAPVIGECHHCQSKTDHYYNCANMDCNRLFLCCSHCLERSLGCCAETCRAAPRLRPYAQQNAHKPFRKWYHYTDKKGKAVKDRETAKEGPLA